MTGRRPWQEELEIIDRTMLILVIFAQHATSLDGKLQVELAQLRYALPRLVEKNTMMSRLTAGPGGQEAADALRNGAVGGVERCQRIGRGSRLDRARRLGRGAVG